MNARTAAPARVRWLDRRPRPGPGRGEKLRWATAPDRRAQWGSSTSARSPTGGWGLERSYRRL